MITSINNCIIEVTRRCNMRCYHCLRGDPQDKSMPREYLQKFLSQVRHISDVTFTGGEPTLPSGMKVINDFIDICLTHNISVGNFYMVTNAKVWRPQLPDLISRLYSLCGENDISAIDISTDQFHERINLQRRMFADKLSDRLYELTGRDNLVNWRRDLLRSQVIEEGRGVAMASGRYIDPPELEVVEDFDEIEIYDGEIYLNCDGNILNGCDMSYKSQSKPYNIICSVSDDIKSVFKSFIKLEEEVL